MDFLHYSSTNLIFLSYFTLNKFLGANSEM